MKFGVFEMVRLLSLAGRSFIALTLVSCAARPEVRVDTASRDIGRMQSVAWVAYTATFECEKDCPYSAEERARISQEVAENSFAALDRELRKGLGVTNRTLQNVDETLKSTAFTSAVIEVESYKSRVGRWFERLGLVRSTNSTVTARGLKSVNPSELGWSGEESLSRLGQKLGVDAVAVGHLLITVENSDTKKLAVQGPKIWFFSSQAAKSLVIAERYLSLPLELSNNRNTFDAVATDFGVRIAHAVSN